MLREEIIQNAIAVFQMKGLKLTIQDIADRMHIAKKTIYQEFPSKESLLIGIADHAFDQIQNVKKNILSSDAPMEERLVKAMIAMPREYTQIDFRLLAGMKEKYPELYTCVNQHLLLCMKKAYRKESSEEYRFLY